MDCTSDSRQFGTNPSTFVQAGYQTRQAGERCAQLPTISPRHTTDAWLLGLGLCAVPASIAMAEFFLVAAFLFRIVTRCRHRRALFLPRAFWFWLAWAALELLAWVRSPERSAGNGKIRHLLLVGALFLLLPALDYITDYVAVWRGIVVVATVSSVVLIEHFFSRLFYYWEISILSCTFGAEDYCITGWSMLRSKSWFLWEC
jgi:hypothetical protein